MNAFFNRSIVILILLNLLKEILNNISINDKINRIKEMYSKEKNLFLKAQMQVILYPEEYSINKQNIIYDKTSLISSFKYILFPFKENFIADWIIENTMEKVEEILDSWQVNTYSKEQFLKYIFKIDHSNYLNPYFYKKYKDYTIDNENAYIKEIELENNSNNNNNNNNITDKLISNKTDL